MNDKQFAYKRLVYVVAFVMACAILLCPYSTKVILQIEYDREMPKKYSRLYYDTGGGFEKENSIKRSLKKRERSYTLPAKKIKALCLDPCVGEQEEPLHVVKLRVYGKDGLLDSWSEDEISQAVVQSSDDDILQMTEAVIRSVRHAARSNYFLRGIGVLCILFAVSFFRHFRKDRIRQGVLWAVVVSVWFYYLYSVYGKDYGFYGQLFVILALVYLCRQLRLRRTPKEHGAITPEKALSLFLLSQTICGSGIFGQRFASFETDILFFGICFVLQLAFFSAFWILQKRSRWYGVFLAGIWIFRYSICAVGYGWEMEKALTHTADYLGTVPGMLSLMGLFSLYGVLWGLFGQGIAHILYAIGWLFVFTTNMIEMSYHATFVKAVDILSVRDLTAIIDHYVTLPVFVSLLILGGLIFFVLLKYRERLLAQLSGKRNAAAFAFAVMLLIMLLTALDENVYLDCFEIQNNNNWSLETVVEKKQGFFAFSYINLKRFLALIPTEPEGYSAEVIEETLSRFTVPKEEKGKYLTWEQKPDVIFLMLEAGIDPDLLAEAYNVRFSQEPDPVLDRCEITVTLADTFGGYTAKSEFEALTGMCDQFFQPGCVPYSAYFTNQSPKTYSIVDVFRRNGYETTAIHQNNRTFYNREAAYQSFGFDRFIAKGDYEESEQDYNADRYMKNTHFLELLKAQLEQENDTPQFIWGVTIESHSPYEGKYDETEIKAECDSLNADQIAELEQFMQSMKHTDDMLGELIAYLESRERPALLVVFGDHLPRLAAWDVWGAQENPDFYYATVCAAYATQGTVQLDEPYLSMNYLAPFVVRNAGIDDEPFYNYLSWLAEQMPVIRSWRLPENGMEQLRIYEMMQYDMLFEKQYFRIPSERSE